MGTRDSIHQMDLEFSTFQLRANKTNILIDGYDNCTSPLNLECSSNITDSFSKLVNIQKVTLWRKYKQFSDKASVLKEIQENDYLIGNITTKDQEKVWISNFYSTRAGKLTLKFLLADYETALENLYDSINGNYLSQIATSESQIASATDALLKMDYQLENSEIE